MREHDTTFQQGSQILAGTLCAPDGSTHVGPGAVILTGSGPLDRNGSHPKMALDVSRQLAHALAARGVTSLRFDKRGVGASPGDWRTAGLFDNSADAQAALQHLAEQPTVDPQRLYVIGHSEGAVLAAAVAAETPSLAGVVLLSGSARSGQDVLLWQADRIAPTLPAPVRGLLRLLKVDLRTKVAANHEKILRTTTDVARLNGARVNARWLREFLRHNPADALARSSVPVLAITGTKDLQVDPDDLQVIARVAAGPVTTHLLEDVTHSLRRQPAAPALKLYKQEVRRPVDPEVLTLVTNWVSAEVPPPTVA